MKRNIVTSRNAPEQKLLEIFDTLDVTREDTKHMADVLIQAQQ